MIEITNSNYKNYDIRTVYKYKRIESIINEIITKDYSTYFTIPMNEETSDYINPILMKINSIKMFLRDYLENNKINMITDKDKNINNKLKEFINSLKCSKPNYKGTRYESSLTNTEHKILLEITQKIKGYGDDYRIDTTKIYINKDYLESNSGMSLDDFLLYTPYLIFNEKVKSTELIKKMVACEYSQNNRVSNTFMINCSKLLDTLNTIQ